MSEIGFEIGHQNPDHRPISGRIKEKETCKPCSTVPGTYHRVALNRWQSTEQLPDELAMWQQGLSFQKTTRWKSVYCCTKDKRRVCNIMYLGINPREILAQLWSDFFFGYEKLPRLKPPNVTVKLLELLTVSIERSEWSVWS